MESIMPVSSEQPNQQELQQQQSQSQEMIEARRGLIKIMVDHFSSTPLSGDISEDFQRRVDQHRALTDSERNYLNHLLQAGDTDSILSASERLQDEGIFPKIVEKEPNSYIDEEDVDEVENDEDREGNMIGTTKRDSIIQQELFRLHASEKFPPSELLHRLNSATRDTNSILDDTSSRPVSTVSSRNQSPLSEDEIAILQRANSAFQRERLEMKNKTCENDGNCHDDDDDDGIVATAGDESENHPHTDNHHHDSWNPFKDLSSWLDGGQGIEVNGTGEPLREDMTSAMPFKIMGTSAEDVSCHPHVLSPPLMESLLAFTPENLHQPQNFWLKYSLVRDGGGLLTFLRQVRASTFCILAIETTEGHVLGAFTSVPWRLSKGWYGSKDTFLWKMRRNRLKTASRSIVEQINQESEIQVYPYRTGNAAVQYCSNKCLMLGQGEIIPSPTYTKDPNKPKTSGRSGKHYGYALYLNGDLSKGTTSTSETFGNPCLIDSEQRGDRFNVANIEVWTLTAHDSVAEAEQSELSTLFLEGGRDGRKLNFMNILSGGPI
jgi:hypothetical protein